MPHATIESAVKALGILELAVANPGSTKPQLAALSGYPRTTANRFIDTLVLLGYLVESGPPYRFYATSKTRNLANTNDLDCLQVEVIRKLKTVSQRVPWPVLYLRNSGEDMEVVYSDCHTKPTALERRSVGAKVTLQKSASGMAFLSRLRAQDASIDISKVDTLAKTWMKQATQLGYCVNLKAGLRESVVAAPLQIGPNLVGALAMRFITSAISAPGSTQKLASQLFGIQHELTSNVGLS